MRTSLSIRAQVQRSVESSRVDEVNSPHLPFAKAERIDSVKRLRVLSQCHRLRRLTPITNASFCARVSCFTAYSRASAFPIDRKAS